MDLIERANQLLQYNNLQEWKAALKQVINGHIVDVRGWGRQTGKTSLMIEAAKLTGKPLFVYTEHVKKELQRRNPNLTILTKHDMDRMRSAIRNGALVDAEVDAHELSYQYGVAVYGGLQGCAPSRQIPIEEDSIRWRRY